MMVIKVFTYWFIVIARVTGSYINPVINEDTPDPGVLKLHDGSGFVVVSTSVANTSSTGPAFPIHFSKDLINWQLKGYVFSQGKWPTWAERDAWAPEIHRVNDCYLVYFSARKKSDWLLAIGVVTSQNSTNPYGPYVDTVGGPIIEGTREAIDIHYYKDPNTNRHYLAWKDQPFLIYPPSIHIQEVEEDGITFVNGTTPTTLLTATLFKDQYVIEAPWILYREPYYYLFYSTFGFLSIRYNIGVARSTNILGSYTRWNNKTLSAREDCSAPTSSKCKFVGPGHGSVVTTNDGEDWMVYHAWGCGKIDMYPPGRTMEIDRITWTDNGWPYIGNPSQGPMPSPSIGDVGLINLAVLEAGKNTLEEDVVEK